MQKYDEVFKFMHVSFSKWNFDRLLGQIFFKSIEFGSVPFCSVFTQTLLNAETPSESFAYLGLSTTMDGGGGVLHMCLDVAAVGGKRFIFPPPPPPRASPPPPLALYRRRRRRSRFP